MSSQSKQMIGEALDKLSNKIFDEYFDSKEQDINQKTQLIASLFQNQLNLENQYRSELIQAGVELPEEDQSANYIDIVNKAGNKPLLETLDSLYTQSSLNLNRLTNAKASFVKGQKIASQYASGVDIDGDGTIDIGAKSPGEVGLEAFRYSPGEESALYASFDKLGIDVDPTATGFSEGFATYNTEKLALDRLASDTQLKQTHLSIANMELENATNQINLASTSIGDPIIAGITATAPMFSSLSLIKNNIRGDEDQQALASSEYQKLVETISNNYPAIANQLNSAVSTYMNRDTSDGIVSPYDGFIGIMADAYKDLNMYLQIPEADRGVDSSGKWIGSSQYTSLHNRVTQYAQTGIITRDRITGGYDYQLLEQAYKIDEAKDNIMNNMNILDRNSASKLLSEGFGFNAINDSLEFIDKESERFIDFNNNLDPAYLAYMDSQDEIDITGTVPEGGIDVGTELESSLSNIEELSTALKEKEKIGEELQQSKYKIAGGLRKYAPSNFGLGTGFVWGDDAVEGKGRSVMPENYVPTDTEIDRIKERFLKVQRRRLNPDMNNTWLESIPVLGLAAQFFPQGAEGVIEEYPEVKEDMEEFNEWIEAIHIARGKRGELKSKKIDIQQLLGR